MRPAGVGQGGVGLCLPVWERADEAEARRQPQTPQLNRKQGLK